MPFPTTGYNVNPWNYYSNAPATATPSYTSPTLNTFIWVQGEQAAKSYPIAPGGQVLMFDSDETVFYIKKADQSGRPLPLEIYDFKKREEKDALPAVTVAYPEFATKDDVRSIIKEELESFRSNQHKSKNKEVNKNA